jgi:hypothetical protein
VRIVRGAFNGVQGSIDSDVRSGVIFASEDNCNFNIEAQRRTVALQKRGRVEMHSADTLDLALNAFAPRRSEGAERISTHEGNTDSRVT